MSTLPDFMSEFLDGSNDLGFETLSDAEAAALVQPEPPTEQPQNLGGIEEKIDALLARQGSIDDQKAQLQTELEREVHTRMGEVEKLILPFLYKLYENADEKPIIRWANRGPAIAEHINKIVAVTRGPIE